MRKAICLPLLLLAVLFAIAAAAQARGEPDWVKNFGESKQYSRDKYLTGFGSSQGSDPDAAQSAQNDARFDAARVIIVDIKGQVRTVMEERQQEFSQHLSSITESSTALQLMGLEIETYEDDDPPTVYALAYVSKADLRRIYSSKKSDLIKQIRRITEAARAAENSGKKVEAATKYLSLYPLYEELKEAETVLLVVGQGVNIEDAFAALNSATGETQPETSPLMSLTEVANKIDQLLLESPKTVDDVARSVIIQLSKQVGDMSGRIMGVPFTYQDKKTAGSFARYFHSALESQLGRATVSQVKGFKPKTRGSAGELAKASGAQWLLSGTYWEQGDEVKIMASLRDADTGKVLAGADALFDAKILKPAGLELKPGNFQQAMMEQNAFNEGGIVSGKLQIDLFTNKGKDNLIFTEGEIMKVYIRVNRPAYVRLLYVLADGSRTLLPIDPDTAALHDNYYIAQSMVNRVVEIPPEFECGPPFGAEMLIAVARTAKLEPLETNEIDGYYFLKAASPREAAFKARGMKIRKKKPAAVEQTEAKIVITTMAK